LPFAKTPHDAARNGFEFYSKLQMPDGHWAGQMSDPLSLPCFVIAMYVCAVRIEEHERIEMIHSMTNSISKQDGGWGLYAPCMLNNAR
jgi:lanosterol synthase